MLSPKASSSSSLSSVHKRIMPNILRNKVLWEERSLKNLSSVHRRKVKHTTRSSSRAMRQFMPCSRALKTHRLTPRRKDRRSPVPAGANRVRAHSLAWPQTRWSPSRWTGRRSGRSTWLSSLPRRNSEGADFKWKIVGCDAAQAFKQETFRAQYEPPRAGLQGWKCPLLHHPCQRRRPWARLRHDRYVSLAPLV